MSQSPESTPPPRPFRTNELLVELINVVAQNGPAMQRVWTNWLRELTTSIPQEGPLLAPPALSPRVQAAIDTLPESELRSRFRRSLDILGRARLRARHLEDVRQ